MITIHSFDLGRTRGENLEFFWRTFDMVQDIKCLKSGQSISCIRILLNVNVASIGDHGNAAERQRALVLDKTFLTKTPLILLDCSDISNTLIYPSQCNCDECYHPPQRMGRE